ncbi:hypothetical protein D9M71_786120 [compost metagenome]
MTQLGGNGFNLFDQRQRRRAKHNFFRPTVFHHRLALHQALAFQTVEQPRQGWSLDADALCQLTLGRGLLEARQVQQHQPAGLGQSEPGKATVEFSTPATRHLGQLHAKTVLIGQRHKTLMIRLK